MKYAIIAAGEGSRLRQEGIETPKPLVSIGGESLIDRLIRIFMDNDAHEIVVICNEQAPAVPQHLMDLQRDGLKGRPVPLRFVVRDTPSSMHSFYEISRYLNDSPFIMTTVDTIFREDDFARYVTDFREALSPISPLSSSLSSRASSLSPRASLLEPPIDAMMGVTGYVDDEKPLYVQTDSEMNVTAFLDTLPPPDRSSYQRVGKRNVFVSAGIYGLTPNAIFTLHNCIARSERRMRNFQRALIAEQRRVKAWQFGTVMDIDHAADIQKAELFLFNN